MLKGSFTLTVTASTEKELQTKLEKLEALLCEIQSEEIDIDGFVETFEREGEED